MDDSESLFGSPPPSPTRGRSPSPILALPTAVANNKNVGTIALPGSHFSEIPIDPLALSSSFTPRSPVHSEVQSAQSEVVPSNNCSSRTQSNSHPTRPARPSRRNNKKSSRPPPPEIHLPDPSQPAPPNFLRSQTALLGTAGLVSGLNPAMLKHNTVGRTPNNPIVIEDTQAPVRTVSEQLREQMPTTREIIYTLIKQKNVFPVLASILKLIAQSGAQLPPPSASQQRSDDGRPTKRRKLRNVPAGAADWDVPFPFRENEGPEEYRRNWQKERVKQLLSQLVAVIKAATEKAAVRRFVENEGHAALAQLFGKRPTSVTPSGVSTAPPHPSSVVLKDSSNGKVHMPLPEPSQPSQPLPSPVDTSGQLSELLTSLFASQNNVPNTTEALNALATDAHHVDPAWFDNWMSIFQSVPEQSAAAPVPTTNDPFAFMTTPVSGLHLGDLGNPQPVLDPALEPPSTFAQGEYSADFAIDPSLLAFSVPMASSSNGSVWSSHPSSSTASPSLSCQDFGSTGWNGPVNGDNFGLLPDVDTIQGISNSKFATHIAELPGTGAISNGTNAPSVDDGVKDKGKEKATPTSLSYEDVIKLAKQRRQELTDELLKTRTELWETTIEQGVLATLAQLVNK